MKRGLLALVLLISACGSGGGTVSDATSGVTIVVNIAANAPSAELLDGFTRSTGIKVRWANASWDDVQTKIATSATSKTYFADVTNVDWSKVGQYRKLGWFVPLEAKGLDGDMPLVKAFTMQGETVGLPWNGSFLVSTLNTRDLKAAGVSAAPHDLGSYTAALKAIKARGVQKHPLGVPLAAAEGLSTYWYELSAAFGAAPLDASLKPTFTSPGSPGYKALEWLVDGYKSGLINPGSINHTDADNANEMAQHRISGVFSDYVGMVGAKYDSDQDAKVKGQVSYLATGVNLGNPDGVGIPRTAKYPKAAAKFIEWFTSEQTQSTFAGVNGPANALAGYSVPSRLSSLKKAAAKLRQGDLLLELAGKVQPVFPGGPPPWYAKFSNAVYTNIHSAVTGSQTVAQAAERIAAVVSDLNR